MVGRLDQPAQDGVGIGLKDAGHGANTEAFRQRRQRPHKLVRSNVLGVKRRAMSLPKIAVAAQTHELPPAAPIRMPVGANIAPVDPAMIRTGGMGAEVATGIDLSATTSGQEHTGWRRTGCSRVRPALLFT